MLEKLSESLKKSGRDLEAGVDRPTHFLTGENTRGIGFAILKKLSKHADMFTIEIFSEDSVNRGNSYLYKRLYNLDYNSERNKIKSFYGELPSNQDYIDELVIETDPDEEDEFLEALSGITLFRDGKPFFSFKYIPGPEIKFKIQEDLGEAIKTELKSMKSELKDFKYKLIPVWQPSWSSNSYSYKLGKKESLTNLEITKDSKIVYSFDLLLLKNHKKTEETLTLELKHKTYTWIIFLALGILTKNPFTPPRKLYFDTKERREKFSQFCEIIESEDNKMLFSQIETQNEKID